MRRDDIDEDLFPLGAPDRPVPSSNNPAGWVDLVITSALFCLSVPVIGVGWFGVLLSMFAFDACSSGGCNYSAGSVASVGFPIAAALSTVLLALVALRRRHKRRRAWMLGVGAILTIVVLFVIAASVIQSAARPA